MQPDTQEYDIRLDGDVLVVRFRNISGFASSDLRQRMRTEMLQPQWNHARLVIVDCSELDYANSMFLETLLEMKSCLTPKHGRIAVIGVNEVVREVIQVSHLNQICPICESIEDAKRTFE